MEPISSALAELRHATGALHERLESHLRIAGPDAGRDDYLHYLQDLYGWLAPFDARLWNAPWPAELEPEQRKGKLAWIEQDLRALDCDVATVALSPYEPDLDALPARFGVAYVIEGSQLGIQLLRRRLTPRLGGWQPRWLQGYGGDAGRKWRVFTDSAERHLATPAVRAVAAEAAVAAFGSLAAWFAARQENRRATAHASS